MAVQRSLSVICVIIVLILVLIVIEILIPINMIVNTATTTASGTSTGTGAASTTAGTGITTAGITTGTGITTTGTIQTVTTTAGCNYTHYWDGIQCQPKRNYTNLCNFTYQCRDFDYLGCYNGTCGCAYIDYWDGSRCQPKGNYTDPCSTTTECRDFNPANLICRLGTTVPPALQCLCNSSLFWEPCSQQCTFTKRRHEACTFTQNCTSNECDISANLQCINDSNMNTTSSNGWCNCTNRQWWNGTYCRSKGTPSWGSDSSTICNASYQCADYALVSCPLEGNYPTINSTCECATTKYWNGETCLDRVLYGQSCVKWPHNPVNTSTCLSAAGAGLYCTSNTCPGGSNCTGGSCQCPNGLLWNSSFLICASITYIG